ncbi:MAG: sulfatase-like hydrolase/transferase [Bdellovibrionales bacterium]
MRRVVCALSIVVGTFFVTGCDLRGGERPSVLVVAVEGLGFNFIGCDTEEFSRSSVESLNVLCEESVRFTHAFTPSTLTQPVLASMLTGLYPFDHGVRTNGRDFLSARFQSTAELASDLGYRTVFISGGPPVWRKSGLAQGFEIFDDSVNVAGSLPFRPAREGVDLVLKWLDSQPLSIPTMAVLYLADLQFPSFETKSRAGEIREKSVESQVNEVLDSMTTLIRFMKRTRRWDRTNVIFVGVNAISKNSASSVPDPLALKSTSTHVTLFVKPIKKPGESGTRWTVDRNVSLVDVGQTLFDWMGRQGPDSSISELKARSLVPLLSKPETNRLEDRLILTESAWADWLEGAGVRWAIRKNQFLYIHDRPPQIFNTLTDKFENLALKTNDPLWTSLNGDVNAMLSKSGVDHFRGMSRFWLDQLDVAREVFRENKASRSVRGGEPWLRWYLFRALHENNWHEMKRLSITLGDSVGSYIASRHLGEKASVPRNVCLRLLVGQQTEARYLSECEDERVHALYTWLHAKSEEERLSAQERFNRQYALTLIDRDLGQLNYLLGLKWDVDRQWPGPPTLIDFVLTLQEFEPIVKKLPASHYTEDSGL